MRTLPLLILTLSSFIGHGQSLHPLEPSRDHYTDLKLLDSSPDGTRSTLDKIIYNDRRSGLQYVGIEPSYLSKGQVEQLKANMKFPANSSHQTRAELDYLLAWQDKRTKAQQERALEIAPIGYWPPIEKDRSKYGRNVQHLFWEYEQVVHTALNHKDYPNTMQLLAGAIRDMRIMEFTVKYHLLRARPYHLEPRLDPMARISSPSFASGHTLWAYIQAFLWSELIPHKREEFLSVAYEVGESREIMGIHYPSDEEAARILAHDMLTAMWKNPIFLDDLKEAQSEWR